MVPMARRLNVGAWSSMEGWIAGCLGRSDVQSAKILVSVTYGAPRDRAFIPTELKVLIEYTLSNGMTALREFPFLNRAETQAIGGRSFNNQDCATTTQHQPPPLRR